VIPRPITVYVDGRVAKPGWLELSPPVTLETAIQLAGGPQANDTNWAVKKAMIVRPDGRIVWVSRKAWTIMVLQDRDKVYVRRSLIPTHK
jgi:protein involved in polysaccharide export with SLBB domain